MSPPSFTKFARPSLKIFSFSSDPEGANSSETDADGNDNKKETHTISIFLSLSRRRSRKSLARSTKKRNDAPRPFPIVLVRDDVDPRRLDHRSARVNNARAIFQRDVVSLDVENQRRGVGERGVRAGVYAGESREEDILGDVAR